MFTFCPLQGARSESAASQSILELDGGVKVLIDIGWDESFDVEKLKELEKQVPTLSLILLTHATTSHLAAFAHCCKNFPQFTRIPVYATRPVIDLGRTLTQDLYSSTPRAATTIPHDSLSEVAYSYSQQPTSDSNFLLQAPTPEEITRYFSLIQPLNSRGADRNAPSGGRRKRDEQLIDMIKLCVSRGGTVLIPADSSGRVLELAYLLEHAWRLEVGKTDSALRAAKLYLAGRNVSSTLRYARSMLEWMDDNIVREFEATADGQRKANGNDGKHAKDAAPFDFRFMRLVEREAQIRKLLSQTSDNVQSEGRVIVASDNSLEWGFSQQLLRELAKDSRNLLILTDKPSLAQSGQPSIARTLWDWWQERKDGVSIDQSDSNDSIELVYGGGRALSVTDAKRQGLEGDELSTYQQWLATQRQLQATLNAGVAGSLEAPADVGDDGSSESSSDSGESDNEQQGKALNISTTMGQATRKKVVLSDEDLGINVLTKKLGASDYDVRAKRGRERCFPLTIRRKRDDQFGEAIRPEDYLRAEEKEEDAQDAQDSRRDDVEGRLGSKRKWEEGNGTDSNKRSNARREGSVDDVDMPTAADGHLADELDDVEDVVEEEILGPSKLITTSETVTVNLRIGFVDFSGLHDKRSLNNLIPLIQPRKLILVGGSQEETTTLAADCKKLLAARIGASDESAVDVFTPEVGTTVDASVDTNAWVVKLGDSLIKKLKWQNLRGLGIVTITGQLLGESHAISESTGSNKRLKTASNDDGATFKGEEGRDEDFDNKEIEVVPVLDTLPLSMVSAVRSVAQPLHVGDLRLTDLRRAMQSAGYTAEFRGEGTLVINGAVAVRKTNMGRIEVESVGVADPSAIMQHRSTFYEVKRMIYDGLAVVAGA
ncbi:hypothetical protein VdG1_01074 [Verticillium dahliae VDG1]|nr:hypothetical protein VdG1_01074 [Verticillium dahliae VDG1]